MEEGSKIPLNPGNKLRRTIRYVIAGATILLLIFLGIEGLNFYRLTPNRLFNEKFEPYVLTTTAGDSAWSKIEAAYFRKDLAEVKRLNPISVLSVNDIFLTGLSYLETNDLAKAIRSFQIVIAEEKKKGSGIKEAAEYYLALTWLKDRDYDQAIELMNSIHNNPAHAYNEKFDNSYINRVKRLKWR